MHYIITIAFQFFYLSNSLKMFLYCLYRLASYKPIMTYISLNLLEDTLSRTIANILTSYTNVRHYQHFRTLSMVIKKKMLLVVLQVIIRILPQLIKKENQIAFCLPMLLYIAYNSLECLYSIVWFTCGSLLKDFSLFLIYRTDKYNYT